MKTRERIFSTAVDMFAKYGYQGVRIENLVKKAKVNKATFYYYFESKKEIFETALLETLSTFKTALNKAAESGETKEQKLDALIDFLLGRDLRDVQLLTREILEGGENISEELFSVMVELTDILAYILGIDKEKDSSFLMFLLVGVSDFYLSIAPFKNVWAKNEKFQNRFALINLDEHALRAKLKAIILNDMPC